MNIVNTSNLKYSVNIRNEENEVIGNKVILDDVNIDVKEGEFIAVLGHNGSGKSTFAKHLNAILMPTEGKVVVAGMDTLDEANTWKIRQNAGMVFQNPDNQIIATVVEEDIGFGPENLGVPTEEIWERVNNALKIVEMEEYRKHSPNKLSGGQKQRVAIAGIVAMHPKCIILDEPTAMLDPNGRKEVIDAVKKLNKEEGVTIILVTHFMNEVTDADRVFVMDDGRVALSGTPKEIFSNVESLYELGLEVPQPTEVAHLLSREGVVLPKGILTVDELKNEVLVAIAGEKIKFSRLKEKEFSHVEEKISQISEPNKDIILEVNNLTYIYGEGTSYKKKALDNVSFKVGKGEILGIIGHTGSGKSTLLQHLNGLIKPSSGQVIFNGRNICSEKKYLTEVRRHVGLVFQYPEYQLFESTVLEDVCFGPKNMGASKQEAIEMAKKSLAMVGIGEAFYENSPFELSGGEKRRVAIAGVLAMKPEVLVLDEPTAGLDPRGRDEILCMLKRLRDENGITIVIVSHSMEDMGKFADRLLVMNKGRLIYDDTPENVFQYYKELEKMGLAAPQVIYIIQALNEAGINIEGKALTTKEVARLILENIKIC